MDRNILYRAAHRRNGRYTNQYDSDEDYSTPKNATFRRIQSSPVEDADLEGISFRNRILGIDGIDIFGFKKYNSGYQGTIRFKLNNLILYTYGEIVNAPLNAVINIKSYDGDNVENSDIVFSADPPSTQLDLTLPLTCTQSTDNVMAANPLYVYNDSPDAHSHISRFSSQWTPLCINRSSPTFGTIFVPIKHFKDDHTIVITVSLNDPTMSSITRNNGYNYGSCILEFF